MFASLKNRQSGDTIIEVLVAIAVVSSVLAITYATMNRNMLLTRDAQERTEASKLAQGQIESFKALSDGGSTFPGGAFCIASDNTPANLTGSAPTLVYTDDNFSDYPAACKNGFYNIAIKQGSDPDGRLYNFYVRWDRVDGVGRNQITMVYRR